MDLVSALRRLLAETLVVRYRAQGYHWNVTGPLFVDLHSLFGDVYSDLDGSVDPIAENLRKLGALAPHRLADFVALSDIPETDEPVDATGMVNDLLDGIEALIPCLAEAFDAAEDANQQGIANFIAERIDATQKWAWQLRSIVGRPALPLVVEETEDDAETDPETEDDVEETDDADLAARALRLELSRRA